MDVASFHWFRTWMFRFHALVCRTALSIDDCAVAALLVNGDRVARGAKPDHNEITDMRGGKLLHLGVRQGALRPERARVATKQPERFIVLLDWTHNSIVEVGNP